jgi:hypothetical protein
VHTVAKRFINLQKQNTLMTGKVVIENRLAQRPKDTVGAPSAKIVYKDVFSMSYLYLLIHEWFVDNGYATRDSSAFPETFYLQRETPGGKELQIRWRMAKEVGPKPSIWKLSFDVDILVLGMKEVELLVNGKKTKTDKGEVEVELRPSLIIDYSIWEKQNPVFKYFKHIILKRFYKKQSEAFEEELINDSFSLQAAIKAYFKMDTFGNAGPGRAVWDQQPGQ